MIVNAATSKTEIKQTSDMLTVLFSPLGKLAGRAIYFLLKLPTFSV